jgi:ribonuclease D
MSELPPHRWVDDEAGLRALGDELGNCQWIALDSESNSGFVYRERLCLLQLNVLGQLWLVDLLALPGGTDALEVLRSPLEGQSPRVILHGGEFDVGCLKRDYDLSLKGVWDTQQAATFLGWERTGYGAVVEEICEVGLAKDFARYDWGKRPLEPAPLRYALDDVYYLPKVGRELFVRVEEADLMEEVEIANRVVEEATWNGGFRESTAKSLDLPPGRVLSNSSLVALSRNPPATLPDLKRLGLRSQMRARYASEVLSLVAEARHREPPVPETPQWQQLDPVVRGRAERLKAWRRSEAEKRGVPLQVVLPVTAMRYLQQHGAENLDSVPQLGSKRIDRYGRQLEKLCRP